MITTYKAEKVIQPIYTGGDVAVDARGRTLATCLGEEVLLTDTDTGDLLSRVEGVCLSPFPGLLFTDRVSEQDGEVITSLASIFPRLALYKYGLKQI